MPNPPLNSNVRTQEKLRLPIHIISQEPWSYVLFKDGNEYIVTFMVGGIIERDFSVRLSEAEIELHKQDRSYVERLVKRLTKSPEQLAARKLRNAIWPNNE